MKRAIIGFTALALMLVGSTVMAEDGAKWFDVENCHFCQPLSQPEGMLETLNWENHNISNGTVSVTTFTPEWAEAYGVASDKMMALWQGFDPAKEYHLCGMCQAWMKVPMDKVVFDMVKFDGGTVSISTSTDPAVVEQLHALNDKTNMEYEKMMKEMAEMEGHEGHGH